MHLATAFGCGDYLLAFVLALLDEAVERIGTSLELAGFVVRHFPFLRPVFHRLNFPICSHPRRPEVRLS